MTRKWVSSWVVVVVVTQPLAFAESVTIATVRAASETASEELKSCAVNDLRSQLFRGQRGSGGQGKSARNPDCYISAIRKLKSLIDILASHPETPLDGQCIERLTGTIASIEVKLLRALSTEENLALTIVIKKLRAEIRDGLFEVLNYCEQKK